MCEPDDESFDGPSEEVVNPVDLPAPKSSGVVVPMLDARGNPFPENPRVEQIGLKIARALRDRIDQALAGGPIRLKTVHLGDSGKAHFRTYLLNVLLHELYGDPIPVSVKPARRIVSPKALHLINGRRATAFNPPGGVLDVPGVRLTQVDLFDLLLLVQEHVMGDDDKGLETDRTNALADRFTLETCFRDVMEVVGAGRRWVRASVGAFHVCPWAFTLTEAWAWGRDQQELVGHRSASPWDDGARRPSHADKRRAWRRQLSAAEILAALRSSRSSEEIRIATERLLKLAA